MTQPPWDPGLQPERTGLAWQRTMLSGLGCSLLVARLLAAVSVTLAYAVGLGALLGTALLGALALRRFRRAQDDLRSSRPVSSAWLPLAITVLVLFTGGAGLAYLVLV